MPWHRGRVTLIYGLVEHGARGVGRGKLRADGAGMRRQDRDVRHVCVGVAMDKVKDTVTAGVRACGDAGPGDLGLGRGAYLKGRITVAFRKFAQVGHTAPIGKFFIQLGVERIKP